jgi:hypothetical protein
MIQVLVDENLSEHFADGLNAIQRPMDNGIEVVSMAVTFGKVTKDEDWIPAWGQQNGVFLTNDLNITKTRQQAALLKQYDMGAFFLKPPKKISYWERVTIIMKHWPEIARIITTERPPYAYQITPKKVERLKL